MDSKRLSTITEVVDLEDTIVDVVEASVAHVEVVEDEADLGVIIEETVEVVDLVEGSVVVDEAIRDRLVLNSKALETGTPAMENRTVGIRPPLITTGLPTETNNWMTTQVERSILAVGKYHMEQIL
jgi:hypothetical protein